MFPKAHAAAYVTNAFRIAWFKVHKPAAYYTAFFSVRSGGDFDATYMIYGLDKLKRKMDEIKTYESVVGALGFCLEEARADAERLEEELMDEAIVQTAHPLYVELLRAQARIDALSEAIELIMNYE